MPGYTQPWGPGLGGDLQMVGLPSPVQRLNPARAFEERKDKQSLGLMLVW